MTNYSKGKIIKVTITGVTDYGVFAKTNNNYSGLIHISELSDKFVKNPSKLVNINETIYAEILDINNNSKQLKLSIKNIDYRGKGLKKKRIIETKHGFKTLEYKLPFWINENLKGYENNKKIKKETNSIDKYV